MTRLSEGVAVKYRIETTGGTVWRDGKLLREVSAGDWIVRSLRGETSQIHVSALFIVE